MSEEQRQLQLVLVRMEELHRTLLLLIQGLERHFPGLMAEVMSGLEKQ